MLAEQGDHRGAYDVMKEAHSPYLAGRGLYKHSATPGEPVPNAAALGPVNQLAVLANQRSQGCPPSRIGLMANPPVALPVTSSSELGVPKDLVATASAI